MKYNALPDMAALKYCRMEPLSQMSELKNKIIIHVMGETDFTSYAYSVDVFRGREGVFGTEEGEKYIQCIGSLMSRDNWSDVSEQSVGDDMTYGQLVSNLLVAIVAGTKSLELAIDNGFNLISLAVFRSVGGTEEAPVFGARMAGVLRTDSLDATAHARAVFQGASYLAPMLLEDIREGQMSSRSAFVDYFNLPREAVNAALAVRTGRATDGSDGQMPVSVLFETVEVDGVAEPVIVCAADADLAAQLADTKTLKTGLFSGVIPTPHGGAGYWLWKVGVGTDHAFLVEQFIDIHDLPNAYYNELKKLEQVRFVLIDRNTRKVARTVFLQAKNLELNSFEKLACDAANSEVSYNFKAACEYVIETVNPEALFEQEMPNPI
jgi:hypothetical protein